MPTDPFRDLIVTKEYAIKLPGFPSPLLLLN